MDVSTECPECAMQSTVDPGRAGQTVRCPRCGGRFNAGESQSAKGSGAHHQQPEAGSSRDNLRLIGGGVLSLISLVVIITSLSAGPSPSTVPAVGLLPERSTAAAAEISSPPSTSEPTSIETPVAVDTAMDIAAVADSQPQNGTAEPSVPVFSDVMNQYHHPTELLAYYPDGLKRVSWINWSQLFPENQRFGSTPKAGFGLEPRPLTTAPTDSLSLKPLAPDDLRQIPIVDRFLPNLRTRASDRFVLKQFAIGYYDENPITVFRLSQPAREGDVLAVTDAETKPHLENRRLHEGQKYYLAYLPGSNGTELTDVAVYIPDDTTIICARESAVRKMMTHLSQRFAALQNGEFTERRNGLNAEPQPNALLSVACAASGFAMAIDARLADVSDDADVSKKLRSVLSYFGAVSVEYRYSLNDGRSQISVIGSGAPGIGTFEGRHSADTPNDPVGGPVNVRFVTYDSAFLNQPTIMGFGSSGPHAVIESALESPLGYDSNAASASDLLQEAAAFLRGDAAQIIGGLADIDSAETSAIETTAIPQPLWPYGRPVTEQMAVAASPETMRPAVPGVETYGGPGTDAQTPDKSANSAPVSTAFQVEKDLFEIDEIAHLPPIIQIYASSLVSESEQIKTHGHWFAGMNRPILFPNPLAGISLDDDTKTSYGGTVMYGLNSRGFQEANNHTGSLLGACFTAADRLLPKLSGNVVSAVRGGSSLNPAASRQTTSGYSEIGLIGDMEDFFREGMMTGDGPQDDSGIGLHFLIASGRRPGEWSDAAKLRGFDFLLLFKCTSRSVQASLVDVETNQRLAAGKITPRVDEDRVAEVAALLMTPLRSVEEMPDAELFKLESASKNGKTVLNHRIKAAWQIRYMIETGLLSEKKGLTLLHDNIGPSSPGDRLCSKDRGERISGLKSLLK